MKKIETGEEKSENKNIIRQDIDIPIYCRDNPYKKLPVTFRDNECE